MRILHLFYLYLPHTQNWLFQLIRHTPGEHEFAAPWIIRNAYLEEGRRFHVRPFQRIPGMMPANEQQLPRLQYFFSALEYRIPLYRSRLKRRMEKNPPDIIHAHFGPVACHYAPLAYELGVPLVASFYGFDFLRVPFEKTRYRQEYRLLFERADAVTTTGPFTPTMLLEQGCPREKIHPITLGVLPERFPLQERLRQNRPLQLVQLATFSEKKGQLDTLEAFRLALADCPDIRLTLAGERQDKVLYNKVLQYISDYRLGELVTVKDFVEPSQLPVFLAAFDVFIHPSRRSEQQDSEGSPLAITEALFTGMPVIATVHADIPAQVLHGVNGFLAPERAVHQLAGFIKAFYQMSPADYAKMCLAAHSHALSHFDVRNAGATLAVLYEMLIKKETLSRNDVNNAEV